VAGLPKLEIKRSTPNRRLFHIEKPSSSFHSIVPVKPNSAKYIESIIRVVAEIDYKGSLKIFNLRLKTLDNSVSRI
jgi:hypothetical protein